MFNCFYLFFVTRKNISISSHISVCQYVMLCLSLTPHFFAKCLSCSILTWRLLIFLSALLIIQKYKMVVMPQATQSRTEKEANEGTGVKDRWTLLKKTLEWMWGTARVWGWGWTIMLSLVVCASTVGTIIYAHRCVCRCV